MKTYKVNVNGTEYEISLELMSESEVKNKAAAPAQAAAPTEVLAPAAAGSETIASPMPGTILSINVQAGSTVKKGDILMVLEAMKMENEIMAPRDGKVSSVNTTKGATVETGTVLCTLD